MMFQRRRLHLGQVMGLLIGSAVTCHRWNSVSGFHPTIIQARYQVATDGIRTRNHESVVAANSRLATIILSIQTPSSKKVLKLKAVSSSGQDPVLSERDGTEEDEDYIALQAEKLLKRDYPSFHSLISKTDNIWTTLSELSTDFTLFVPNEDAFKDLGSKRLMQLKDERNLETAQKMGLYHVVATDVLTPAQLQTEDWTVPKPKDGSPRPITIGGVITMAGKVPIGRRKVGGFLGWGAKDEGNDVVIGPTARIVRSIKIAGRKGCSNAGSCIVHEMDALVSPEILWRYCDQLTIPGLS